MSDSSLMSRFSRRTRPSGRTISCSSLAELQGSTIREEHSRTNVSAPTACNLTRTMKLIDACANAISEHAQLKLLSDSVRTVAATAELNDEILPEDTMKKLKEAIVNNEVNMYLQLPASEKNDHEELNLLGIEDLPKVQFTPNEKRDIHSAVQRVVQEKTKNFIDSYQKLGGNIDEIMKNIESAGRNILSEKRTESGLLRWKDSTDEVCSKYHRDLITCADLLCHWKRLKNVEVRELNAITAENRFSQSQVMELQSNILRKTCAMRMFTETPCSADAFRILSESLDNKIQEARENIRSKELLRKKYADVSSSKYDELLNKYTELCSIIQKKEHMMKILCTD